MLHGVADVSLCWCREESLWNNPSVERWPTNYQKSCLCKCCQSCCSV